MLGFVVFHLVSGVLLERSHASPASALSAFDAMCPLDTQQPQAALPYD